VAGIKDFFNEKSLLIRAVEGLTSMQVREITESAWIVNSDQKIYLVVKRLFSNRFDSCLGNTCHAKKLCLSKDIDIDLNNPYFYERTNFHLSCGDRDSFIFDMNGIDNFMYAKSLIFNDFTMRKILLKMKLISVDEQYIRLGATGVNSSQNFPGGEVFEYSLISGKDGSGFTQSVCGHLFSDGNYSKSIPLFDDDASYMREERIIYMHNAILKKTPIQNSVSSHIKIRVKNGTHKLLDIIQDITEHLNIVSYSIFFCINETESKNVGTEVKGRILKRLPTKPFNAIEEATDIGSEKIFSLKRDSILYGVGTHYDRYEPEWEKFTGGRKYERRGHIHATIVKECNYNIQFHETFHLREIFISSSTDIELVLTPINTIYRAYPLIQENNCYFLESTGENIQNVISV